MSPARRFDEKKGERRPFRLCPFQERGNEELLELGGPEKKDGTRAAACADVSGTVHGNKIQHAIH